jgi:DNA-binding LacI/PurR family transcriptional regulator
VRTPYYEFGAQSASLLLDIITQKVKPPQSVVIEHSLIVRESSGQGPKAAKPVDSRS